MLTATVQFCGAGGTSEAARLAGIQVEAAINHSKIAIASHEANHPNCEHYQQDITEIDPKDVPDSDFLLTSPCCTNHSPAKGQRQYHQFDLFGDIVFDPRAEKSRNTMEDVVRFSQAKYKAGKPYTFVVVENVVDVVKWRKYHEWLESMIMLDLPGGNDIYHHKVLYWNSQFFGVPQSRDRVYIVFWLKDSVAPPALEHRPAALCQQCKIKVQSVRFWKSLVQWGSYQEQYVYVCPYCAREVTPFFVPVREVLDLEEPGETLFNRSSRRELCSKTLKGIDKGIQRLNGEAFLYGYYNNPLYRRLDEPVGTITTADRWALVTPMQSGRFEDTTYRMLTPREVQACMGFSAEYKVLGTVKERVWQLGNAVCPAVMQEVLHRCVTALEYSALYSV